MTYISWSSDLGDNCIQNIHMGRYIIVYMVGNFLFRWRWRVAVKRNFRPYNRWWYLSRWIDALVSLCCFTANISTLSYEIVKNKSTMKINRFRLFKCRSTTFTENISDFQDESVTKDVQKLQIRTKSQKTSSREPKRKSKRPEIQRYIPKGKILEQHHPDLSGGEPLTETWIDGIDWQKDGSHSPSPGPDLGSPSPRKIDLKNMQVTVVNEQVQSPKDGQKTESMTQSRQQQIKNQSRGERGQQGPKFQGRRSGPRTDLNPKNDVNKFQQNRSDNRKAEVKEIQQTSSEKEKDQIIIETKVLKDESDKDPKSDFFIVPSRPSTIGQEAERSSPVVGDVKNENVDETSPNAVEVKPLVKDFINIHPSKTKSRSYDKLNKTENWDEEEYYPDAGKLGTLVFERSRSSEQLNLTGKNTKPPIPRSASGGGIKTPKKYVFSSMRKRADSFSSDISTGMWFSKFIFRRSVGFYSAQPVFLQWKIFIMVYELKFVIYNYSYLRHMKVLILI